MPTYDIGLEHVSLAFATKTIFTDVTQGVFEGDRIGIVGKNGDGKSTLLHLFRGTQEPDSGRVTKRGGLTFGMLDQRDPLDDNATIREAALEGRADYEWASDNTSREIVEALLGGMSLDAKVGSLSGGQRRRADLARLLLKDWDILALECCCPCRCPRTGLRYLPPGCVQCTCPCPSALFQCGAHFVALVAIAVQVCLPSTDLALYQ